MSDLIGRLADRCGRVDDARERLDCAVSARDMAVRDCVAGGIPVREVASTAGVSTQRVYKILRC